MLDAGQVRRAVTRIALGSETRPPDYHNIQNVVLPGAKQPGNHWTWKVASDCLSPVWRQMYGRPFKDRPYDLQDPQWIEIEARCRKCERCLRQRAKLWMGRTLGELRHQLLHDRRTWFVTLTSNPTSRTYYKYGAMGRFNRRGKAPGGKAVYVERKTAAGLGTGQFTQPKAYAAITDFGALSEDIKFGLIHQEIGRDITQWLKRLRQSPIKRWVKNKRAVAAAGHDVAAWVEKHPKPPAAKFRYLLVTEAHKLNEVFPHYHLLIHETEGRLFEEDIRSEWRSRVGFAEAKLVKGNPEDWLYLCKYLSKDSRARVRASAGYGTGSAPNKRPKGRGGTATSQAVKNQYAPLKEQQFLETETTSERQEERKTHGLSNDRLSVPAAYRRLSKSQVASLLAGEDVPTSGPPHARWERADASEQPAAVASPKSEDADHSGITWH